MTLDILLFYYDNAILLDRLLYRMYYLTDFQKFKKYIKFIIADSGTLLEKVGETEEVVDKWKDRIDIIYFRCDTDVIREDVEKLGLIARPCDYAANIGIKDISVADIILLAMIGQVYTKTYFENIFIEHIKNKNIYLLPRRFDLVDYNYHEKLYNEPFDKLDLSKLFPGGGHPDMSCRREHILADRKS